MQVTRDEFGDHVCEHGTAMDVHCCNCHSGFIFDRHHECPDEGESGPYLWHRCYACGHRLVFASTACPQCGIDFDGRDDPAAWPEICACPRCATARTGTLPYRTTAPLTSREPFMAGAVTPAA